MGLWTGIAVYFIIWWLSLFLVLPFGARATIDDEDIVRGHDASAPKNSRILIKMAITTVIAGVLFAAFYGIFESDLISFRQP
jgi:predicted secreted protein